LHDLLLCVFDLLLKKVIAQIVLIDSDVDVLNVLQEEIVVGNKVRKEVHNAQQVEVDEDYQDAGSPLHSQVPCNNTNTHQSYHVQNHENPITVEANSLHSEHVLKFKVNFLRGTHLSSYEEANHSKACEISYH
jgi:hypothetical protein